MSRTNELYQDQVAAPNFDEVERDIQFIEMRRATSPAGVIRLRQVVALCRSLLENATTA